MDIKSLAHQLGFAACGIAKAAPVEGEEREKYLRRVEAHRYADMDYMYRNVEKRLDPTLLVPGTKSIISVALNYAPAVSQRDDSYKLAAYALGKDYHDIMKRRLRKLATTIGWEEITMKPSPTPSAKSDAQQSVSQWKTDSATSSDNSEKPTAHFRVFVDSAPVLERYWAQKAGLGWIGRNNLLIIPHAGTMFFLGEIFVDVELDYDTPAVNRCGRCTRCIDACPTGALKSTRSMRRCVLVIRPLRTVARFRKRQNRQWTIPSTAVTGARLHVRGTASQRLTTTQSYSLRRSCSPCRSPTGRTSMSKPTAVYSKAPPSSVPNTKGSRGI